MDRETLSWYACYFVTRVGKKGDIFLHFPTVAMYFLIGEILRTIMAQYV